MCHCSLEASPSSGISFCTFRQSAFSVSLPFSGLTELENSVGTLGRHRSLQCNS